MRIVSKVLLTISAFSAVMNGANAALVDRGGGLIYDEDLHVTWLKNANVWQDVRSGLVTWSTANTWAAQLEYADDLRSIVWADWQLPTSEQLRHLYYSELGGQVGVDLRFTHNSNYDLFDNIQPGAYWSSTPWWSNPADYVETVSFYIGDTRSSNRINEFGYAWAIRTGDVGAMGVLSEPGTSLLGLVGLLGLFHSRSRRQRT